MTVKDVKQLVPEAEVYELSPELRYIIKVPTDMASSRMREFAEHIDKMGIDALLVRGEIRFFAFVPGTVEDLGAPK